MVTRCEYWGTAGLVILIKGTVFRNAELRPSDLPGYGFFYNQIRLDIERWFVSAVAVPEVSSLLLTELLLSFSDI